VADVESGLGARGVTVDGEVYDAIAKAADGDARCALNMLEQAVGQVDGPDQPVTMACVREWLSSAPLRHDRDGDAHYDIVSAFIKSMRGSDPDASLYYLARLLEAGDEPRFIFRRMLVFAAEDVGNADPRALGIATDGARAFEQVGMPEGRIILGQVCTYLACAPKSNAAYKAMDAAIAAVRETGSLPVPMKLRNAASALMRELGHGKGYVYPHDHGGYVPEEYAPEALRGRVFYEPGDAGYERHIQERLLQWRRLRGDSGGDE